MLTQTIALPSNDNGAPYFFGRYLADREVFEAERTNLKPHILGRQ